MESEKMKFDDRIQEFRDKINKKESEYKNCGLKHHIYSRKKLKGYKGFDCDEGKPKEKRLYWKEVICGKQVKICPRCKRRKSGSQRLKFLKTKLEGYKLAVADLWYEQGKKK
jgi:hypothetical protein